MSDFTPPSGWKRTGGEWHGPCPITGEGKDGCWVVPEKELIGCRKCVPGNGKLDGQQFLEHAKALGIAEERVGAVKPRLRRWKNVQAEAVDRMLADEPEPVTGIEALAPDLRIEGAECQSEREIARRIVGRAQGRLRYIGEERSWWLFEPEGWCRLPRDVLVTAVMGFGEQNYGKTKAVDGNDVFVPAPTSGGKRSVAEGAVTAMQGDCYTEAAQWDAEPGMLGLPGGRVLTLATGERRKLRVSDLIRWRLAAAPATADELEQSKFAMVVQHVFRDEQECEYVQRRLGAALADTSGLDDIIVLHGEGGSGKGSFVRALKAAFGTYARGIPPSCLLLDGKDRHEGWLVSLRGGRLFTADELGDANLDGHAVKEVLGTAVTAAAKYQTEQTFELNAPIVATSNHSPSLAVPDGGVDRRLKPIAAGPSVGEFQDESIRTAMQTQREVAAVVRWLLDGYRAYREGGCPVPVTVRTACAEVREASPLAEFAARYARGSEHPIDEVYTEYRAFMRDMGARAMSKVRMGKALVAECRWERDRTGSTRMFVVPMS